MNYNIKPLTTPPVNLTQQRNNYGIYKLSKQTKLRGRKKLQEEEIKMGWKEMKLEW